MIGYWFGDCSFSRFVSIVRSDRHTQSDADERFTLATVVGVSNNCIVQVTILPITIALLCIDIVVRHKEKLYRLTYVMARLYRIRFAQCTANTIF